MLSEIQGGSRPIMTPTLASQQPAASVVSAIDSASKTEIRPASADMAIQQSPKVQAPKPVEIKVDIQKMKANLQESIEKVNQMMRDGGRNLSFTMDEKLGGMIILVKNTDTGEVVRQIPNDAVVRMAHSLDDFKGMLHNELS